MKQEPQPNTSTSAPTSSSSIVSNPPTNAAKKGFFNLIPGGGVVKKMVSNINNTVETGNKPPQFDINAVEDPAANSSSQNANIPKPVTQHVPIVAETSKIIETPVSQPETPKSAAEKKVFGFIPKNIFSPSSKPTTETVISSPSPQKMKPVFSQPTHTITQEESKPVVQAIKEIPPSVLQEKKIDVVPETTIVEEGDENQYEDEITGYKIEDRDTDDESGTDDEAEKEKKKKNIPEWASGENLRRALEKQYGLDGSTPMDPDSIFPEVQSCNLEEIFGKREGLTRK